MCNCIIKLLCSVSFYVHVTSIVVDTYMIARNQTWRMHSSKVYWYAKRNAKRCTPPPHSGVSETMRHLPQIAIKKKLANIFQWNLGIPGCPFCSRIPSTGQSGQSWFSGRYGREGHRRQVPRATPISSYHPGSLGLLGAPGLTPKAYHSFVVSAAPISAFSHICWGYIYIYLSLPITFSHRISPWNIP